MAGQQQIEKHDLESVYQKHVTQLKNTVEADYIFNHFRIGVVEDNKLLKSFLFEKYLCSDNCEFINFFYKTLAGKKEPKKKNTKEFYRILKEDDNENIVVNNYYAIEDTWTEAEW